MLSANVPLRCNTTAFRALLLASVAVLVAACATTTERVRNAAENAGYRVSYISGTAFTHFVIAKPGTATHLDVYIEGDGTPWIDGFSPAADPTGKLTPSFDLMLRADRPSVYLGRPCYFAADAPSCSTAVWTHERFSAAVVESMAAALEDIARRHRVDSLTLIGHSGGGTIAMLLANRVAGVSAVVTIGAPLDIQAWTDLHGYEPLKGSLNPVDEAPATGIAQIHLAGTLDRVVPIALTQVALARLPTAILIEETTYDHVCCWSNGWGRRIAALEDAYWNRAAP